MINASGAGPRRCFDSVISSTYVIIAGRGDTSLAAAMNVGFILLPACHNALPALKALQGAIATVVVYWYHTGYECMSWLALPVHRPQAAKFPAIPAWPATIPPSRVFQEILCQTIQIPGLFLQSFIRYNRFQGMSFGSHSVNVMRSINCIVAVLKSRQPWHKLRSIRHSSLPRCSASTSLLRHASLCGTSPVVQACCRHLLW